MANRCTVCKHPRRAQITRALVAGGTLHATAKKYGFSRDALVRHLKNCTKPQLQKAIEEERAKPALAAHEQLAALDAEAARLGRLAEDEGELGTALAAVRERVHIVELRARIFGELDAGPTVQVLVQHPDFRQMQADVARALALYPEARARVLAALSPPLQAKETAP